MIGLPRPHEIVHCTQKRNCTRDQDRPIHRRERDFLERGPEAEEEHECKIHACESVVCNAERARELPRAPDGADHAVFSDRRYVMVKGGAVGENGAGAAAVEEETRGKEVGCEEASNGDGNDAVERGCRADVDECQDAGDDTGESDGIDRNRGPVADLT